ncbi:AfsR/SARP family transcriptional regulator [Sphaerisporangium corydalis]|uniref:Tetratricopeptide repeat protein n=1 Tax=Sphaerisporangium corydalis TaxID=1441875 RepID=A0ABV9E7G3_9ACTN|nr:tetratricopeptide repeat protein [Sphaerisporangium corydalis]
MEFRILGPVELWSREQRHDLDWARERLVLAILLMTPGRAVPIRSIIGRVWDDNPPGKARARLQSSIARLRGRLQEIGDVGDARLRGISGAYILETDVENIDYHRFRRLRAEARASADAGETDHAIGLYHEAAKLWRGEPLAGLHGTWAETTRANLENEMLGSTMERVTLQHGVGEHTRLIAELSELVTRFPFDERLVELLMRTLYVSGRQADALAAYRQAQGRLNDQVGTEAGPALQELHQRILLHDPTLLPETRARKTAGNPPPNDLPRDIPTFTGRTAELARLTSAEVLGAMAVPVLAVDGMPGVGKTAFAVHLAHLLTDRYPDGRLFLDLHGHSAHRQTVDPAAALDRLLRHLGVPGEGIPEDLDARAALWRKELARRKVLIVLDNAAGHEQISHLLPGVPGCLVIVTSRRRLAGLDGVESLSLDVLPAEDSATLLDRAAGTRRVLESEHVAAVTRLCGHLPLALQLVGSRLRHRPALSVADLAERLGRDDQRLTEIRAESRHIIAAFRLSYEELAENQRRAFVWLGYHPGLEFTAHSSAALFGLPLADAEQLLDDLLDQHLIAEPRPGRYRFHDLIRDYAVSLSGERPESERTDALHRLFDYYLFVTDRADRLLYQHRRRIPVEVKAPPRTSPALATADQAGRWLSTELENLLRLTLHASDNGWTRHAALLPHILSRHLSLWRHAADAIRVHTRAINAWQLLGDRPGVARAMTDLSEALWRTGRLDECLDVAAQALRIQQALGDEQGVAEVFGQCGLAHWHRSEFDLAMGCFEQALKIKRGLNDRYGMALSLNQIAGVAHDTGDYRAASDRLREVLALHEEDGNLHGHRVVLNNLGEVEARRGQYTSALSYYERAAAIVPETSPKDTATLLHNTANVLQHLDRYGEALERYKNALRIYREIGDRRCEAQTLNSIGDAHQRARRHQTALEFYDRALQAIQGIGDVHLEAEVMDHMGLSFKHVGDQAQAQRVWQHALELYDHLGLAEAHRLRMRLQGLSEAADS